jgi:hypothetical protein
MAPMRVAWSPLLTVCLLEDNARCTADVVRPNMHALAAQMSVRHDHEYWSILETGLARLDAS